jgi:hypothetical protein
MPPDKFDVTFAMKAIGLSDRLNGTDKRVGLAILDHYNRRTGRCDPSRTTLAELLQITTRSVTRSIARITKADLFRVIRHGGHNNCNSYQPNWKTYRALEDLWKQRRRHHANRFLRQRLSSSSGQSFPFADDRVVHQTNSTNHFQSTSASSPKTETAGREEKRPGNKTQSRSLHHSVPIPSGVTPSAEAARNAAERRWNLDLWQRFGHDTALFSRIIEQIDAQLVTETTDAEFERRGAGLPRLIKELVKRGLNELNDGMG